jgi:transposase-like protein
MKRRGKGSKGEGDIQGFFAGEDPLTEALRGAIRERVEEVFEEELAGVLGAVAYQRIQGRQGYRHGKKARSVTTAMGLQRFQMPRGRVRGPDGRLREWQSQTLPRYQRRAKDVEAALVGVYIQGVNTRRVKAALRPMLKKAALSASTVSRIVSRVKEAMEAWRNRSLAEEAVVILYLDAIHVKVRMAGRVRTLPVLLTVGVREDGTKALLGIWQMGSEGEESWKAVLTDLTRRGLRSPLLGVIDGCPGLRKAVEIIFPGMEIQRCTVHKLRNLLAHAPKALYDEVREDYHRIVYAACREEAEREYRAFLTKWRREGAGVARSLEEAGEELLTFFRYPKLMWKALRTTNMIERLLQEFRRRVKVQCSLPSEQAVMILFYGLYAGGAIRMRKIDGCREMKRFMQIAGKAA